MEKIKDLKVGSKVDIFGLVELLQEKQTSNNKEYVEMIVVDNTGKINVKVWDASLRDIPEVKVGSIIKIRGTVDEWNKNKQIIASKSSSGEVLIRPATAEDGIDINELIEVVPIEPKIMLKDLTSMVKAFENEDLKKICLQFFKSIKKELLYFPGAQTIHHAVKGGLLYHVYSMVKIGEPIADYYGLNKELLLAGIIIHDIGKIEQLDADKNGKVESYTKEGYMLGHMIQGIKMLNELIEGLDVDKEVVLLLEHMIASHHFEETWGAYQKPMFIEAKILHYLDMVDSRVDILSRSLEEMSSGELSPKNPYLERKIYKPAL